MLQFNRPHRFRLASAAFILTGAVLQSACTPSATKPDAPMEAEALARCDAVRASIEDAGFAGDVAVTCEGGRALIASNTYPDHPKMTGIVATNEQVAVPANYAAPIPLSALLGTDPLTRDSALAVAVNGVPIFDYTGGGEMSQDDLYHHQTQHDTLITQQLDQCGGHAGRGNDYHYHVKPTCMIDQMENAGDDAIIGWAFDGFPIYGDNNPDGTPIADDDLDVCNGQEDAAFGYRYHTSQSAPYIIQCLMGEVADERDLPRVAPLSPQGGGGGLEPGRPPRGGVEGLVFTENADGSRSMDYRYQGAAYYMRYRPADADECYEFETKTVTNGGEAVTGVYCR